MINPTRNKSVQTVSHCSQHTNFFFAPIEVHARELAPKTTQRALPRKFGRAPA